MKQYPSISKDIDKNRIVYAFDKLDGSNIRAEWSRKRGFHKFGSRKRLLGSDQFLIAKAEALIVDRWEKHISTICRMEGWDRVVFFFEFLGDRSFAGNHVEDDEHRVELIDVSLHKSGIIQPAEFLNIFGSLPRGISTAQMLYHGPCDAEFVESVVEGTLQGMSGEGVVCKSKGRRKSPPHMFKIKSQQWLDRLRDSCDSDSEFENRQ